MESSIILFARFLTGSTSLGEETGLTHWADNTRMHVWAVYTVRKWTCFHSVFFTSGLHEWWSGITDPQLHKKIAVINLITITWFIAGILVGAQLQYVHIQACQNLLSKFPSWPKFAVRCESLCPLDMRRGHMCAVTPPVHLSLVDITSRAGGWVIPTLYLRTY